LLQALQQPEWVKYSLVYFGAPFRFVPGLEPVKVSLWCGAVVVSLSLYAITHCLRRRRYLDTSTLFAFAIVLFVGATGVLIAMGRTSLEISNMWASRYGSMVVMLFPALLMIMAPLTHWREVRWFPVAVMIAIIGYAVATEPRFLHEARYWTDARKGALTAAVVGVRDKEDMFCPCSLELILNQVATLRSRHQSIYAEDWPFWIGRELADSSISLVPRSQCGGSIEEITPVADGARVRGWIRDRAPQRASRVVIFADERNRIVGVALGGHVQYDDVPADRPESESQKIGWRGHVTGHYGSTTVQALGLGQNHSSACEFGVVSWPTAAPPIGEGSQ
jgi:hypothetical protein